MIISIDQGVNLNILPYESKVQIQLEEWTISVVRKLKN